MVDDFREGDICALRGSPSGILVRVVQDCFIRTLKGDVRWNPLVDDYWRVELLTGPEAGLVKSVYCYDLRKATPLAVLAMSAD